MLKKIFQSIFFAIALLFAIFLQTSFLGSLNFSLPTFINLPLSFLVATLFIYNSEKVFISSLIFGFFLDFFTSKFFGFYLILFLIEFFVLKFFLENILQNKSLRSLLVANFVSLVIWFLFHLIYYFIISNFSDLIFNFRGILNIFILQILISSSLLFVVFRLFPFGRNLLKSDTL